MYCVYLTTYSGDVLPKFYVGSTSLKKIQKGYRGSVRSKKYRSLWKSEQQNNQLFQTSIISTHATRQEALDAELKYQQDHNVIQSTDYINMSFAAVNGYFGVSKKGSDHPLFGIKRSEETKARISKNHKRLSGPDNPSFGTHPISPMKGKHHLEESKIKMSENRRRYYGSNNANFGKKGELNSWFGQHHSHEAIAKMKGSKPVIQCPHCLQQGGKPVMVRFHFSNCKSLSD